MWLLSTKQLSRNALLLPSCLTFNTMLVCKCIHIAEGNTVPSNSFKILICDSGFGLVLSTVTAHRVLLHTLGFVHVISEM